MVKAAVNLWDGHVTGRSGPVVVFYCIVHVYYSSVPLMGYTSPVLYYSNRTYVRT